MTAAPWHVQLLGGLKATHDDVVLAQFPSRPVAMLLARLALFPRRRHPREELIELMWPGVDLEVGRNRLRQVLSTLRRLLEPPGVLPASILLADRQSVGLHDAAFECDVERFERCLRDGDFAQALHWYRGDLLPGFFDEWVEDERMRLRSLFDTAQERGAAAPAPARARPSETAPALPSMFATRDAPVRNLPAFVTVFFGRHAEQQRLHEALSRSRLVTLSGFGGCGKTRLAVEVARAATGVDTVAFAPLAECRDPGQIADRIRVALRMPASDADPLAQLCIFLAERDVLLLLDNFEQLVDAGGAAVVVDLLGRLPRLRCLVTSRRVLDVAGECEVVVAPLPLPDPSMALAEVAGTPSVALFIDRARGARADFALTAANATALVELSRALEGLPLAIEIAASRVRAYSPAEMRDALAQRFELIARHGSRAQRHGRHASLQTTVEWSWQLLAPAQQRFLAALSVFRGGSTASAIEAVCAMPDAHVQLEALVADSLLNAEVDADGATRFSMLETIREFACERLADDAPMLRARHRAHFLRLARQAGGAGIALSDAEFPNLRQAIDSALDDGDPAAALALGLALRAHWEARGMPPALLLRLEQAVQACPPADPQRGAGLELLAWAAFDAGDVARAHAQASAALAQAGIDAGRRAAALVVLARVLWERDQLPEPVESLIGEAFALLADLDAPRLQADALRVAALVALRHGAEYADYARADALFERAQGLYRVAGQPTWAYRAQLSRAGCLTGLQRYDEARGLLTECEQHFEAVRSQTDLSLLANMRGYLESGQEHWPEALVAGRRCVQIAWERQSHLSLTFGLWNLPQPLTQLGQLEAAVLLKAFAARFWQRHIGALSADDADSVEVVRRSAAEQLGSERVAALWEAGAAMSLSDAVRLALNPEP